MAKSTISNLIKARNFLKAANYLDQKSNYKFADKLQLKVNSFLKKGQIEYYDAYNEFEISNPIIIDWMMRNQDTFGAPHEKKIYDPGPPVGQTRDVIGTKPTYYEDTFSNRLNFSYYSGQHVADLIIKILPNIEPKNLKYLLNLAKTGYFLNNPISEKTIKEAFDIPNKNNANEQNKPIYELAKYIYSAYKRFRDIPFEVIKKIVLINNYSDYNTPGVLISPSSISKLTQALDNYLFYGDINRTPGNINIPTKSIENEPYKIPYYKEIYNFAINNEDKWGVDYTGALIDSFYKYNKQQDNSKSDSWKIARAYYGLNYPIGKSATIQTYPDENLLELQNNIDKIYRFKPNTEESDRLLIFFSKYPGTFGIPLSSINEVEEYTKGGDDLSSPTMTRDLPKILNVFGKNFKQWLDKFDGDIHEASQLLPFGQYRELKDLGLFLLQHYGKYNTTTLNLITSGWKDLTPEQKKLPIKDLERTVFEDKAQSLLSTKTINNINFAMEAAKWWQDENDDDEDDDDYDGYDDEDDEVVSYSELEKTYLDAQKIPLPKWANNNVTIENLRGRFLPRSDPRGLFLGFYSNSCQHPWNVGRDCAYDGLMNPKSAFFVVENVKNNDIIAQSWVWEDINGNIVFDNVEANGIGLQRMPIVQKIYKQIADKMENRLVNIGTRGTDMEIENLPPAQEIIRLQDPDLYSDADFIDQGSKANIIQQRTLSDNRLKSA